LSHNFHQLHGVALFSIFTTFFFPVVTSPPSRHLGVEFSRREKMSKNLKFIVAAAFTILTFHATTVVAQFAVEPPKADRKMDRVPTPEHLARVIFNASKSKEFYKSAKNKDVEAITKLLAANGLRQPIKVVVTDIPNVNGEYCTWVPIWYWTSWPNTGYYQLWLVCSNDGGGWQTE
jgi:hypothetical protein